MAEIAPKWGRDPNLELSDNLELEKHPVWFHDNVHTAVPFTPMGGWFFVRQIRHGCAYGDDKVNQPRSKSVDFRLKRYYEYASAILVTSEEEIKQREARFREQIVPFVEDFDNISERIYEEATNLREPFRQQDPEKLSNMDLLLHFEGLAHAGNRLWDLHMLGHGPCAIIYSLFENMCRELLGFDERDPRFQRLLRGFPTKVYEVDYRMWQLAMRATEMGLGGLFLTVDAKKLPANLEGIEAGRQWLKELREFLEVDGWRTSRIFEYTYPTWIEDPTPALDVISRFVSKGGEFRLEQERSRKAKEREETEREVLSQVPDEQREWFEKLMKVTEMSTPWNENHNYHIDLYITALMRRALVAIGKRLAAGGSIDSPDDVHFLLPDDVMKALPAPEYYNLRPVVKERREVWEASCKEPAEPIISRVGIEGAMKYLEDLNDYILTKTITGEFPVPRPELKADFVGRAASAGVVEGPARVVLDESQFKDVQPGDILVAPCTYVSWTPLFAVVSGVVIDRGGGLCHAAIVGREYGIPVVHQVFDASKKIKSGQRIRVDGNTGAVYIIEK